MFVKFIKYCPWSFNGRVVKFPEGVSKDIPDRDAKEMIEHGYAVIGERKPAQIIENILKKKDIQSMGSNEKIDFNEAARYDWYSEKFTLGELKEIARNHPGVPYKTTLRTKPLIIQVLVEYEKESGTLIKED